MCPFRHYISSVFASDTPGLSFQIPTNGTDSCCIEFGLALQRCILSEGMEVVWRMGQCIIIVYHATVSYQFLSGDASMTNVLNDMANSPFPRVTVTFASLLPR